MFLIHDSKRSYVETPSRLELTLKNIYTVDKILCTVQKTSDFKEQNVVLQSAKKYGIMNMHYI